ncbi:MAG TPA: hypothetical protein VJV23_16170 [Candidatus Polarisedimenticolia bacterium]|nr:hypothetical protein [Candidatus Polarisedimenticolia bacterium]
MFRLLAGSSMLSCLLSFGVIPIDRPSGETLQAQIAGFLKSERPLLVVHVISPWRLFYTNVDLQRFEGVLKDPGPDYLIQIRDPGLCKRLAEVISATAFDVRGSQETLDLRYKVEFLDQDRKLFEMHASPSGELLLDGTAYLSRSGGEWLRQVQFAIWHDLNWKL